MEGISREVSKDLAPRISWNGDSDVLGGMRRGCASNGNGTRDKEAHSGGEQHTIVLLSRQTIKVVDHSMQGYVTHYPGLCQQETFHISTTTEPVLKRTCAPGSHA